MYYKTFDGTIVSRQMMFVILSNEGFSIVMQLPNWKPARGCTISLNFQYVRRTSISCEKHKTFDIFY